MASSSSAGVAPQFSSEGFDLDAVASSSPDGGDGDGDGGGEVIYEIGGGVSAVSLEDGSPPQSAEEGAETKKKEEKREDPCAASESHKLEGNAHFKAGEYLDALDCYASAIGSCPGPFDGEELLRRRDEFDEKERARMVERHREETERRRREEEERYRRRREAGAGAAASSDGADSKGDADGGGREGEGEDQEKDESEKKKAEYRPPHHPHAKNLAIYHCNRAACSLHLEQYDDALRDCDVALLLNPSYAKAYLRRMTAYERMDKTEEALRDARSALFHDPSNVQAKRHARRLEKIEEERMEKLKEETMGKLKDLGNSILGNFGLSLDNFKTEKDPKTGGYSISFQQNG